MHRPSLLAVLTAGLLLQGAALAQDAPAAGSAPKTQSAPKASTTGSQTKAPGAKTATGTAKGAATGYTLKTQKDKASYALGMSIGTTLHRQGVVADPSVVARGLKDAMAGGKTLMTEDEMKAALQQLRESVTKDQQAKAHAAGEGKRKEGDAFLASNKAKDGVKVLPDGLQYKILKEGSGAKPTASDTVTVNYRGTLISGKEFDSSYKRGQPATFPVGGVIKGWTEALQLMPVGSKWELYIPSDLAYGDRGAGPDIGPGETLVFEVELLSIGDKK